MIGLEERIAFLEEQHTDMFGASVAGLAVTRYLLVNPDGDGTDGLTRRTAYPTVPAALDAASLDANDLTLILIAPHATYYDINTTGDPTWSANVMLCGSIDDFVEIRNDHASATSILKLTGKSSIINAEFDLGTGNNGVILTMSGASVNKVRFVGVDLTGAATALHLDGVGAIHAHLDTIEFHGHVTHMTGLLIDRFGFSDIHNIHCVSCLTGIQIVGSDADENDFLNVDIGDCALGLDIDAGNTQHFKEIGFHDNTRNVDDEVGDHAWLNIFGRFDIEILPDDFTGIAVTGGGAANTYGADTELLSAASRDNPFRVVGVTFEPNASPAEWYFVRFSDDSGATFYDILQFEGDKREGVAAPSGTEHIFNPGTRISCSAKSVSGGNDTKVWVEVQEI